MEVQKNLMFDRLNEMDDDYVESQYYSYLRSQSADLTKGLGTSYSQIQRAYQTEAVRHTSITSA